jgi:dCTP deaminase
MSILSDKDILKLIKRGKLVVKPFDPKRIQPGALEVRLGKEFMVLKKSDSPIDTKKTKLSNLTKVVKVGKEGFVLKPDELVLVKTKESIKVPKNLIGWLVTRSSFAKLGLIAHLSSGFIHPGSEGKQTLELCNLGGFPLRLYPGQAVCQIVFEKTVSPSTRAQAKKR